MDCKTKILLTMKLLSIRIENYKNLSGTYDFNSQNGYIALIGENGSGKSNLLEAISLIFGKLYKISNIQDIGKFRICYEIDGTEYSYGNIDENGNDIELDTNPTLPSSVISCYSGEDMRLWHTVYENYYMQYFKKAINNRTFSPKIMYISKYCWKIAFIALLCSNKDKVKSFLKNCCHYDDINDISIKFTIDPAKREKFKDHLACLWYDYIVQRADENGEINANIFATTDMIAFGAPDQYAPDYVFQFLYLLSIPEKNKAKKQTIDKLINDITINIKGVNFEGLSEGEKKMILIECITQILGDKNSLVLLDEPDAHSHIARKKELLEAIETFEGQTILTTHSPVFANLLKDDNICYINFGTFFDKNKSDIVAAISDKGIDVINGACIVSSKVIVVVEGSGDIEYITKAIKYLKERNPQYEQLLNLGFIPQGSADHTEAFYNDIVSKLPQSVEKIIYLFDNDNAGKLNAKKIEDKPKVSTIFYQPQYDTDFNHVYYIEDYIPTKYYPEQFTQEQLNLSNNGEVKYYQLKEVLNLANKLKGKVNKIKDEAKNKIKQMQVDDFVSFKPLLDQILSKINN